MPHDPIQSLATSLMNEPVDHFYATAENDDGQMRWECSCGETGNWNKTSIRLRSSWRNHVKASRAEVET